MVRLPLPARCETAGTYLRCKHYTYNVSLSSSRHPGEEYRARTSNGEAGWANVRQPDPEPRPPLTRERVLRAALDLADEGGIDALTCAGSGRRSGSRRCRSTTTWPTRTTSSTAWSTSCRRDRPARGRRRLEEAMRGRAVSAREAFARHPGRAPCSTRARAADPARLRYFEWVIGTLRRAGFSVELAAPRLLSDRQLHLRLRRQQFNMTAGEADTREMAEASCGHPRRRVPLPHRDHRRPRMQPGTTRRGLRVRPRPHPRRPGAGSRSAVTLAETDRAPASA